MGHLRRAMEVARKLDETFDVTVVLGDAGPGDVAEQAAETDGVHIRGTSTERPLHGVRTIAPETPGCSCLALRNAN